MQSKKQTLEFFFKQKSRAGQDPRGGGRKGVVPCGSGFVQGSRTTEVGEGGCIPCCCTGRGCAQGRTPEALGGGCTVYVYLVVALEWDVLRTGLLGLGYSVPKEFDFP